MRILLSGSSGFIGSALLHHFHSKGDTVIRLSRGAAGEGTISWNPDKGTLVKEEFEGFDAVIHLGGASITERWSEAKKREILLSRTVSTFLLSTVLAQLFHPPKVFISASAVGFYGDQGDALLTEKSPIGKGFLPRVCREWEKAAAPIEKRGARGVQTRFGVVIGNGGMVDKLLLPFRLGLGGSLGSGEQWMSWIALEDLVRGIDFALHDESIEGPVNFVSPYPVRQKEFAQTLGKLLHRPTFFRQPAWILKLLFGQMAEELLLSSARVEPSKLLERDFHFHSPHIRDALQKALV